MFWGCCTHPGRASGRDQPCSGVSVVLMVSLSAAGCTFEEDGDLNQCEYSQGEDDDFGWELIRSYMVPHLTADLPHGESWPPSVSSGTSALTPWSCTPEQDPTAPPGLIPAAFYP